MDGHVIRAAGYDAIFGIRILIPLDNTPSHTGHSSLLVGVLTLTGLTSFVKYPIPDFL